MEWMDYVMPTAVEWMEMDARTIHFHISTQWMVDVEWIATLILAASRTGTSSC